MLLTTLQNLVESDLAAVNQLINDQLQSGVSLIDQLGQHIVNSGGKRLRPLVVLLSAKACGYQGDKHINLAAAIEFFHTATLLHDDVVDESRLRRGKETANTIWGNKISVLVGDFLFTRAFQNMVKSHNLRAFSLLADASNTITKGEVVQLGYCHDATTTEQRYMGVIRSKTATLFQAAAEIGAVLAKCDDKTVKALADYGSYLGNAFQLVDDALDYSASSEKIGKNIGDDLAEGKPTLPFIYAMQQASTEQQMVMKAAIEEGSIAKLDNIIDIIKETKAIEYTYNMAHQQLDKAISSLQVLSPSPHREALQQLVQFAVARES